MEDQSLSVDAETLREGIQDVLVGLMSQSPAGPDTEAKSWQLQAACAGMRTQLFFTPGTYALALATCGRCPVIAECRRATDDAERGEPYLFGIFAGETPQQRKSRRNGHAV